MKKLIQIVILIVFTNSVSAQWQWSKQIGGLGSDILNSYSNGTNIFVCGTFQNQCHIDADILNPSGYNDILIAKYDATCSNRIWLKQISGTNTHSNYAFLTLVTQNGIYIHGLFSNSLTIDGITISSIGNEDAFLAKLDLNGTCQWIKSAGGAGDDFTSGLTIDGSGFLYWSIQFQLPGYVDTIVATKGDIVVKLDESGTVSTSKNLIHDGYTTSLKVYNNVLYCSGISQNDTTIIGNDTLLGRSVTDALLIKCDLSLNPIWSTRFGGSTNFDFANDIDIDSEGNIYTTGKYGDTLEINGNRVISLGAYDMFIAKFDSLGSNKWLSSIQSSSTAYGACIVKSASNHLYLTGKFSGTAQFGSTSVNTINLSDAFLTSFDLDGNCEGVYNFGSAFGNKLSVTTSNDVIMSGTFQGNIDLDTQSFTSYGGEDSFIAKADAIINVNETNRLKNQLEIYANPNKGDFSIKVPDAVKTFKDAWLLVFDNAGKQIGKFSLEGQSDRPHFDVSEKGKGVYQVKLIQGNASYSGQMVVE